MLDATTYVDQDAHFKGRDLKTDRMTTGDKEEVKKEKKEEGRRWRNRRVWELNYKLKKIKKNP